MSKRIIAMCKSLPKNSVNYILMKQCVRSGTSIGANYREADEATTTKDFVYRLGVCKKEAKETVYWLDLIAEANPELVDSFPPLKNEVVALIKIFYTIIKSTNEKL